MADEAQNPNQPQAGLGRPVSPPAIHASQFAFYHTATDIGLSFATTRMLINPESGLPTAAGLEWLVTVMMSPTLAQQLYEILEGVLADYERKFGVIPKDPNFNISTISAQK
jgi:hypothetical protein